MEDEKLKENPEELHEHEEECECEHEHHHHHHHDEECECEHEHEHEHHHHHHDDDDDDECECGHEHHHHHHHHEHGEHCDCEDCVSGVSINHHDGALAGSFSVDTDKSKEELDEIIRTSMQHLCELIESKEGVIGHIKSAILCGEDAVMYSLTLDVVNRAGDFKGLGKPECVSFAAIIYGLEDAELRSELVEIKEKIE